MADDAIKDEFENQRPGASKPIVPFGHDRFFKLVLDHDERATEIIKHFLPAEIAALMSDEPVKLIDGSFIDPSLGTSQSDRLFEVKLTSGDALLVYTLLEHKSYLDAMTPLQVEEYKFKIWRRYHRQDGSGQVKLPPIVTLVFYHGSQPWTVPLSAYEMIADSEIIRPQVRSPGYVVCHLEPDRLKDFTAHPEARGGFLCLWLSDTTVEKNDVQKLVEIIQLFNNNSDLEIAALRYIFYVVQPNRAAFNEAIRIAKPTEAELIMGSFYQEVLAEGRAKGEAKGRAEGRAKGRVEGRAKGRVEGRVEGKVETFIELARVKFGRVPKDLDTVLRQASQSDLDRWLRALLDAKNIDEVLSS